MRLIIFVIALRRARFYERASINNVWKTAYIWHMQIYIYIYHIYKYVWQRHVFIKPITSHKPQNPENRKSLSKSNRIGTIWGFLHFQGNVFSLPGRLPCFSRKASGTMRFLSVGKSFNSNRPDKANTRGPKSSHSELPSIDDIGLHILRISRIDRGDTKGCLPSGEFPFSINFLTVFLEAPGTLCFQRFVFLTLQIN